MPGFTSIVYRCHHVSLALRLIVSSTTNCATERDHAGLCLREPNFIFYFFLRMPGATGFTNTSFRRRGVVLQWPSTTITTAYRDTRFGVIFDTISVKARWERWCGWNCDLRVINARKKAFSVVPKASPWRWKSLCAHMRTTSLWGVPAKWPVGLVTGSCHSLFFFSWLALLFLELYRARYINDIYINDWWSAASKSAHLNCTNETHFRLTAGRFRGNSCIAMLWVACGLLQFAETQ